MDTGPWNFYIGRNWILVLAGLWGVRVVYHAITTGMCPP